MTSFFRCNATNFPWHAFGHTGGKCQRPRQGSSIRSFGKGFARHGLTPSIIKDYRLTTAEIVYRLPDHPAILQSYVWQAMDIAPDYPALHKFLSFWRA